MPLRVILSLLLACLLAGCSDSPEHKLSQARIALNSGRPEVALKLIDEVLEDRPNDAGLLLVKAGAHLRLGQFEPCEATLLTLKDRPEVSDEANRELLAMYMAQMQYYLTRSEFLTSDLHDKFNAVKERAYKQSDWLTANAKAPAEADFARARLIMFDITRMKLMIRHDEGQARNVAEDPQGAASASALEEQKKTVKDMQLGVEKRLHAVLKASPDHVRAMEMLIRLMADREGWNDLWVLAEQLAARSDLTPTGAGDLMLALLAMPDKIQPEADRLATSAKLLDAVSQQGRQTPQWKLLRARFLLRTGKAQQALELVEEVHRLQPSDPGTRFMMAWTLYSLGRFEPAKGMIEHLAVQYRGSDEIQTMYGMILVKTGEDALAIEAFRHALAVNDRNVTARGALLNLYNRQKNSATAAIDDINKLYEQNREDPSAIRLKLLSEIAQGGHKVAGLLADVERIAPRKPGHLRVLVDGYVFLRKYDIAVQHAQAYIEAAPQDIESHLGLAKVHLIRGETPQARELLTDLHEKHPNHPDVNETLAGLFLEQGAYDRSVDLLQEILRERPEDEDALLLLAQAYSRLLLTEEAIETLNVILGKTPEHPRALLTMAMIYRTIGQPEVAQVYLDKIDDTLISEKRNPGAAAQLMLLKGQTTEALAICQAAIGEGRTDPLLRMTLVGIYEASNQLGEEQVHLTAFARQHPDNPLAYQMLARFYARTNPLVGIEEFRGMRKANETSARIAEASLHMVAGQPEAAYKTLAEHYNSVIVRKDSYALEYARIMAAAMLKRGATTRQVAGIFEALVSARLHVPEAMLALADLTWRKPDDTSTLIQLDEIARLAGSSQKRVRGRVIHRYVRLDRRDLALAWVNTWLEQDGPAADLLTVRADLEQGMNQPAKAIESLKQAIALAADSPMLRVRLAQAHIAAGDFPQAEATLDDMAKMDTGARIRALWAKSSMYLSLGLNKPAVDALKGMETLGRTNDPRVRLALGQGLAALGQDEEARNQLSLVPRPAQQYPAAQFLLVRLEQKAGAIEQAKRRLESLAADSRTVEMAVSELINLTLRSREHQQLLDWSDKVLKLNNLPASIRLQWLAMRRAIQSAKGDLTGLDQTLAATAELNPEDVAVKAARAALLLHLNRKDEALKVYQGSPALMGSDLGSLLAVAMGQTPAKDAKRSPLTRVLESLAAADVAGAVAAAEAIPSANNTLYRSDVRAFLAGVVTKVGELPPAARQTALAAVAMEAAMPMVAELAAEGALAKNPKFAPAHALLVSALHQQGKSIDQARGRLLKEMPDSTLNLFLSIRQWGDANKTQQAIDDSLKLLEREPGHDSVRYRLATFYIHLNKMDDALAVLEAMAARPGPLQSSAINDLAFLLAEHKPQRREEARKWSAKLVPVAPQVPAFADTIGWIEHLDGKHDAAIEYLSRSVLGQPGNTEVHYHLALAYQAAKQPRWARFHFEAAAAGPADKPYVKDAAARLKAGA